jgi:hypothetical protein
MTLCRALPRNPALKAQILERSQDPRLRSEVGTDAAIDGQIDHGGVLAFASIGCRDIYRVEAR